MSGHYLDRDGNLVHTRSGDIVKTWKEVNRFTGEGEYLAPRHSASIKEEKGGKDSKVEILLGFLRSLDLDVAMTSARFEEPIDDKKLELLLKNLETLRHNVTKVLSFAKKLDIKKELLK